MSEFNTALARTASFKANDKAAPIIYVPQSFKDADKPAKVWQFRPWEIRFLDALNRGLLPEDAYKDLGLTQEQGERLLRTKKAREYIADRTRERMIVEGWTQDKWISEISKVWYGQKEATREQMEAIKELGARICPKPEKKTSDSNMPAITINIGKVESALNRQKAIDAEIISGSEASS